MKNSVLAIPCTLALSLLTWDRASAQDDPFAAPLATILNTTLEGQGNVEAAAAWKTVVEKAKPADLVRLLSAIDSDKPVASNWIRSAAETVSSNALVAGESLPAAELKAFVLDKAADPKARGLAFAMFQKSDGDAATEMIPGFLQDSSAPLRRLAVADRITQAKASSDNAKTLYTEALDGARDVDQIKEATKALRDLGETVDLPRQMGFLTHWQVIGPFDNEGRKGFHTTYPPEAEGEIDLAAEHDGKSDKVKWEPLATADEFGMLDFNKPYGLIKETVGYAMTEYEAPEARAAEIRLGCKNAWKVWLNGELLFERDEYHRGARVDQYTMPCQLKKGRNVILVKCCQNEQQERWTVEWQFQLRVCDRNGTALLATNRLPTPKPEEVEEKGRRDR